MLPGEEYDMGSWSQRRPKKRRIALVGGGFRYSVSTRKGDGGSMKAKRRAERKLHKAQKKRNK